MIGKAEDPDLVLYPEDKRPASTMTGAKAPTDKPKQEILAPHVQGYLLGWLTGHWEFDRVLLRAYKIIPEKHMKALRRQLRQVRLTPYTVKLSDGSWADAGSARNTGTVIIRPDVVKRGYWETLIVILHELAHQVDYVLLSPIMAKPRHEGEDYDLISEWAAILRVTDWGYDFELRQALGGDGWPHVPSEEEARRIAHRIRSECGSWYGLVRGMGAEDAALDEWWSPKTLLPMIDTVILVDRLFDLWGYRRMNPKFVPKMMKAYEDFVDGQEL